MHNSEADKESPKGKYLLYLTLGALGVVYGDIGTSPLYAMRECFRGEHPILLNTFNILGVLSLIFWSLIIVISVKYIMLVMRADNEGEGGILALMELVCPNKKGWKYFLIITMGLFGAALLYGDGMITPAISVLSAVEGLKVATPLFEPYVIPITIVILFVLFYMQKKGTGGIGAVFGPIVLIWFFSIAALGVRYIITDPRVLIALNPYYAFMFFAKHGVRGIIVLGAVFLVVTGGEAIYADMGHFGRAPIRWGWFVVVLPCLVLNYFGQGALLIQHPEAIVNPFYHLAPQWAIYPLVVLATIATVIASQAVISGAFSLTFQALQLGYIPRMALLHTSEAERGQIYIPVINWVIFAATVGLVWGFKSSDNLAAAYGVAVTTTMVITSLLAFVAMDKLWNWTVVLAFIITLFFLSIDLSFFSSNILKIPEGGWFPLMVGGFVYVLMATWHKGRRILSIEIKRRTKGLSAFLKELVTEKMTYVDGTAIYMTSNPDGVPPALLHNLKHNKILHKQIIVFSVDYAKVPHIPLSRRLKIEELIPGFYKVIVHYGFMDKTNINQVIKILGQKDIPIDMNDTTFFLGRETLLAKRKAKMAQWREQLFVLMARNAQRATEYFNLPPDRVFEVGAQIEL